MDPDPEHATRDPRPTPTRIDWYRGCTHRVRTIRIVFEYSTRGTDGLARLAPDAPILPGPRLRMTRMWNDARAPVIMHSGVRRGGGRSGALADQHWQCNPRPGARQCRIP